MSTNNGVRRSKVLPVAGVLALAALAGTILASQSMAASASQHQQSDQGDDRPSWIFKLNNRYSDYEDGTLNVRAGAGGAVAPLTWFFPKNAEIKVGETVVWRNPTTVSEP